MGIKGNSTSQDQGNAPSIVLTFSLGPCLWVGIRCDPTESLKPYEPEEVSCIDDAPPFVWGILRPFSDARRRIVVSTPNLLGYSGRLSDAFSQLLHVTHGDCRLALTAPCLYSRIPEAKLGKLQPIGDPHPLRDVVNAELVESVLEENPSTLVILDTEAICQMVPRECFGR